ncbi:hypothetical protein BH11BAC2_BH11BAC2_01460 [soil metagenome]
MILLLSCNAKQGVEVKTFFSLKDYFDKEINRLTSEQMKLHKLIVKDGKSEEKDLQVPIWKSELESFRECDFNRPAWIKSYRVDTFYTANQTHLTYKALELKLPVQKLEVILKSDTVYMINIMLSKKNAWYSSEQFLSYEALKGYSIKGTQKVVLADPTAYQITADFKP